MKTIGQQRAEFLAFCRSRGFGTPGDLAWDCWQEQERRFSVEQPPWANLVNEERDGVWAHYSAYEEWLKSQMPEYAAEGYEEADDHGSWKVNVYAVVAGLFVGDGAKVDVPGCAIDTAEQDEVG